MIQTNELRIGNFFRDKFSLEAIRVICIEEKEIHFSGYFPDKWQAEPIPLTEELLLKCGFIENGDTSQFHLEGQIVSFSQLDGANFWIMDTDKGIRCKYLHQLQNTWHIFKGKELEIKL